MLLAVLVQLQDIARDLKPRSTGVEDADRLELRGIGRTVEEDIDQGGTVGRWCKVLWVGSQRAAEPLSFRVAWRKKRKKIQVNSF